MDNRVLSRYAQSLRWIADRNPFYLLSACCGLVGCWLLGDIARADIADVAVRIASLLVYQVPVVVLALWLARRDRTHRDAAILSVLTVVLAADFAFFYTQSAMLGLLPASLFTIFGAAQSLGIVGILLRGLRAPLTTPAQWLLAVDLAFVHVLPLVTRLFADNELPLPLTLLIAFTAAGALMAAHAWPARWRIDAAQSAEADTAPSSLSRGIALAAPIVALASGVAHIFALEWVYDIRFIAVFLSPLCLGAATLCLRLEARRIEASTRLAPNDRVVLPLTPGAAAAGFAILAVFFALGNPGMAGMTNVDYGSWIGISPLRLTLLGAAAIFWGLWRIWQKGGLLILVSGAAGLMLLGHTPEIMLRHIVDLATGMDDLLVRSLPTSRTGWGMCLFAMAFLLLGAGASISWWKTRADRGGAAEESD